MKLLAGLVAGAIALTTASLSYAQTLPSSSGSTDPSSIVQNRMLPSDNSIDVRSAIRQCRDLTGADRVSCFQKYGVGDATTSLGERTNSQSFNDVLHTATGAASDCATSGDINAQISCLHTWITNLQDTLTRLLQALNNLQSSGISGIPASSGYTSSLSSSSGLSSSASLYENFESSTPSYSSSASSSLNSSLGY